MGNPSTFRHTRQISPTWQLAHLQCLIVPSTPYAWQLTFTSASLFNYLSSYSPYQPTQFSILLTSCLLSIHRFPSFYPPVPCTRTQFALTSAFCLTISKPQGQGLNMVALLLTAPALVHASSYRTGENFKEEKSKRGFVSNLRPALWQPT